MKHLKTTRSRSRITYTQKKSGLRNILWASFGPSINEQVQQQLNKTISTTTPPPSPAPEAVPPVPPVPPVPTSLAGVVVWSEASRVNSSTTSRPKSEARSLRFVAFYASQNPGPRFGNPEIAGGSTNACSLNQIYAHNMLTIGFDMLWPILNIHTMLVRWSGEQWMSQNATIPYCHDSHYFPFHPPVKQWMGAKWDHFMDQQTSQSSP